MMVALLLYAYAVGERSSRAIERRCREDVAFRVICANRTPDHATIARFRARHEQALADTSRRCWRCAREAGLVSVGLVALDGTLIAGNASPGGEPQLRRRSARRSSGSSARPPQPTPPRTSGSVSARGDELPAELADRSSRRARLRPLSGGARGRAGRASRPPTRRNLAWRAAWEAEHGRKLGGRKPTAARPRGARAAHDQHDRSRHAADGPGRRAARCRATTSRSSPARSRSSSPPSVDPGAQRRRPAGADGRRGAHRARSRGRSSEPIGTRAGRRRLLELAADRRRARARDRGARPDQDRRRTAAAQARAPPGRGGPPHRGDPGHPRGRGALPPPPADRRAGLRPDEVPAAHGPLPTPRTAAPARPNGS